LLTQTHLHRHTGDLPETDSASHYTSSIAYFPGSYPFPTLPAADVVQSDRTIKQNAENNEWWSTGVLHDFNNLLAIILSHSAIALTKLPADHPAHRYVERVVRATKRAADISSQLLVDMSHQLTEPATIDLNRVVQDTIELLEPRLVSKAEIRLQLKTNLNPVLANITQIQQVVMNLLLNAAEAIEQTPGRITVTTANFLAPEPYQQINALSLPAGPYVYLQVVDTGIGMDQTIINHIFEPQFTTKPTGTGIGLTATIYIIKAHKGAVRVFSAPGRGTAFEVFLPAAINEPKT
jgi:two-component system cell cycle sensor histidine kinase/response regulator CckA